MALESQAQNNKINRKENAITFLGVECNNMK